MFDPLDHGIDRKDKYVCISARVFLWMNIHLYDMLH